VNRFLENLILLFLQVNDGFQLVLKIAQFGLGNKLLAINDSRYLIDVGFNLDENVVLFFNER
jgi:hypothetical protein